MGSVFGKAISFQTPCRPVEGDNIRLQNTQGHPFVTKRRLDAQLSPNNSSIPNPSLLSQTLEKTARKEKRRQTPQQINETHAKARKRSMLLLLNAGESVNTS